MAEYGFIDELVFSLFQASLFGVPVWLWVIGLGSLVTLGNAVRLIFKFPLTSPSRKQ